MARAGNITFRIESESAHETWKKSGKGSDDTAIKSYHQCIFGVDRGREGVNRKSAESLNPYMEC